MLIGRFLQVVTSILVLRLMTATLSPNEMGKFTLIMSIISFFALIFINPIGMYFNRRLHDWYQRVLVWQALKMLFIYVLLVAFMALLLISFSSTFYDLGSIGSIYWILALVFGSLLFNTMNQTVIPTINMLGKRGASIVCSLLTLWLGLLVSILLTSTENSAELWISGQLIGLLLGSGIAILPLSRVLSEIEITTTVPIKFTLNKNIIKTIFIFAFPISLTVGLNWIQFQSYRFIVSELISLEYLGLFAAGYALSLGIMSAFEATAMQYFYPIFYKKISGASDKEKTQAWNEYASVLFPLTILTALFIVFMSVQLTHILLDPIYWGVVCFVIWGAVTEMGRILGNAYGMVAHATMKTRGLVVPQLVSAVSSLILVPLMLIILPQQGLGVALAFSAFVYVISMHITMRKQLPIKANIKLIFRIILLSLPILCIAITSLYLKGNFLIDISLLAISGIIYLYVSYYVVRRSSIYDK